MQPQFEDETPLNPFDFWEGANFKLKICKVEGYRNYDRSEFESPSALHDDDSEIERIWKSEFDLREFIAPTKFKSYDDLKKRLDTVLGNSAPIPSAQQQAMEEMESYMQSEPPAVSEPASRPAETTRNVPPRNQPAKQEEAAPAPTTSTSSSHIDEEDEASYFASLLND